MSRSLLASASKQSFNFPLVNCDAVMLNIGCYDEFSHANRPSAAQSKCRSTAVQIYSRKWCHTGLILEHRQIIKKCQI